MPSKNNGIIIRGNLMRLFDSFSDRRIIYVCAPAGYGKTVLVRQWVDSKAYTKTVITLDEYDNNPIHFCERFCAALCAAQKQNSALLKVVSNPAFGSAPDEFTLKAIGSLSKRKRIVMVIDDLHFINNETILHLLPIFLKRLPDSFQIIIMSRNDLPEGFSDLWIKGHLARVDAKQIRFSGEEIMQLYKKRSTAITPEQAKEICKFTNGWAIGINALLLSGGKPSGKGIEHLESFIRSNIWEKWDENTREFMLNTAMARKLYPSLCDALTGNDDSERVLQELMRSGAFIFQTSSNVYYYHHLFRNFLINMLKERGDEYIRPLIEKEGHWHLSQRDFYSAVKCFIKCKNYACIANCFNFLGASDRNNLVIEKMLTILQAPEVLVAAEEYPFLFPSMAWAAFAEGRPEDMIMYLTKYYEKYSEIVTKYPIRPHNIFLMRMLDFREPLHNMKNMTAGFLNKLEPKDLVGSITMHMPLLHRSTRDFSELTLNNLEENIENLKSLIGWLFGTESGLLEECMRAGLLYERGILDKAHAHVLASIAKFKDGCAAETKFCAFALYIHILDALGREEEAEQVIKRISMMIEAYEAYYLNHNFKAMTARRKLARGDMQEAYNWIETHKKTLCDNLSFYTLYENFTTCRAYITYGDFDGAIILITKILGLVKAYNRPLDIIEAQILLSIAYWKKKRGFQNEALGFLEEAVSMAYPFGYTQLFTNDGAELSGMMRRLQWRSEQRGDGAETPTSFIKMLYLKTLEDRNGGLTSGQAEKPVKYTEKQMTVMKLICAGNTYREIAEAMGIKIPTLRSHISLIYKKLDVTNETDAIMKIKALGILED